MSQGALLAVQAIGILSGLMAILAVSLIVMRAGFGAGLAMGLGAFLFAAVFLLPYMIRAVGSSMGLSPDVIFLGHSIGGLVLSGVTLLVAVLRWPRPQ